MRALGHDSWNFTGMTDTETRLISGQAMSMTSLVYVLLPVLESLGFIA
jgi:hypothetical protein